MKINRLRVVPDTNIILSSIFRFSPYREITDAFDNGQFDLYLDCEILSEYEEMLISNAGIETSRNFSKSVEAAL